MKYADEPNSSCLTSKPSQNKNNQRIDVNKTKHCNPRKQVSVNKRLCHTIGCGKETQNKLLVQINEAEQVSDFERILNSNAIQCERVRGHVWHGYVATQKRSASVLPRPRSAYSLYTVSQAYQYLFRQHEESLEPLIEQYRQANAAEENQTQPNTLESNWYENLRNLSEFYEDDQVLKKEVEDIANCIISEEIKPAKDSQQANRSNRNFNVNLAGLFGLHLTGEGISPTREHELSPDLDTGNIEHEEEWLESIMSATDDRHSQNDNNVECLAQNLDSVKIDSDAKVPTITFSNCCDGYARSDQPNNNDEHLVVPTIDSIDEARPPMM